MRAHLAQDHRYAHTIRVARLAATLARRHGEDSERARLAGLLHDLARLYSAERLVEECAAREMPISAFDRAHPIVLHARLGAELARERFGVDDEAVLSAIRKHTVADALMSPLDRILCTADALEPGRDYAERAAFLALALGDLGVGMREVLASTIASLRERGLSIAPQTWAAWKIFAAVESSLASKGEPPCLIS